MLRPIRLGLVLALAPLGFACISNGTHKQLMDEAMAAQKKACAAEMKKQKDAAAAATAKEIGARETRIKKLESDLKQLGLDMNQATQQFNTQLTSTKEQLEALRRQRESAEQEAAQFRALAERLKSMVDAGKLQVVMRKGRMTLKLPDEILFPTGSKNLKPDGKAALISVSEALKEVGDRDFLIAGHTDNVPVKKGAFRSNWDLSTARAVEVVDLMIKNGVAPEHLAAAGFGEFDPIGDNTTDTGRQQNRRLEIIIMPRIENIEGMPGSGAGG